MVCVSHQVNAVAACTLYMQFVLSMCYKGALFEGGLYFGCMLHYTTYNSDKKTDFKGGTLGKLILWENFDFKHPEITWNIFRPESFKLPIIACKA